MFIDYYGILEINFDATQKEISAAYKKQALKWHPDRNINIDTNFRMQQINEAYLILKDVEGRERYDIEYKRFKDQQRAFTNKYEDNTYEVFDQTLNKWILNARKQAVKLATQTVEDILGMSKKSGNAMLDEVIKGVLRFVVFSIIMSIIIAKCR
jgi:DnaJ-class molecular chaperone